MTDKNKKIDEVINPDNTIIHGDQPTYNPNEITSNKTTDQVANMTQGSNNAYNIFGMGYTIYEDTKKEDEVLENILPKSSYDALDMLTLNKPIELPNIYNINNPNLVQKLKSLVSTLNTDDNEQDKVAVFADFIKNVNISNISTEYKKALVNLLKEKI